MGQVFFGARDYEDSGDWRWMSTNASLSFNDWKAPDPQVNNGERCAAFYKPTGWKWANEHCWSYHQFICEITV